MNDPKLKTGRETKHQQFSEKTLHMRGIPKWEFERYLVKQATVIIGDTYQGEDWQVTLSEERQESIGMFTLVAVDVTIRVEKDQFDDFLLVFRKNFLRGGG